MSSTRQYVALDLGAESGRAVVGRFDGERLHLEQVHRFANGPVQVVNSLYWDILYLWREIKEGLARCAAAVGKIDALGVDAWAIDYGLLDERNVLLGNPYCYRDSRTDGMVAEVLKSVPADEVYRTISNPPQLQITTLCQLLSEVRAGSPALAAARTLLTISDLLNFWLSGQKVIEFTRTINTQCYNPVTRAWATNILEPLGIPAHIFPPVVPSGTVLGDLLPGVAEETRLGAVPVVATACHDSAAAVIAVPTREADYLFLSSGTWSVLGTEIDAPYISPEGPPGDLWNEGGAQGNIRFTSNVMGLWLVQECRRLWASQGETYSYDELTEMAAAGTPFASLIDPNDARFLAPGDMPGRVQAFCQETGQPVPTSKPDILRCILESLALKYRQGMEQIEAVLGRKMAVVHIVGGGIQNRLLCQFTANAMRLPAIAGPVEATALGNIIMQAIGLGHLTSVQEGRELVRASVELAHYEPDPQRAAAWEDAYERFLTIAQP
ncbi:MAG: rhamnulokinase [Anaerolineales bacterium]|nr:rhamnulokinase [Anaerolineales bacterium]